MTDQNKGFSTVTDTTTDLEHLFENMNAGVFKQKVEAYLNAAAAGVVNHGNGKRKGKVNIQLTIEQVGEGNQVMISHAVQSEIPTKRGKKAEVDTTETSFFVGRGGKITFDQPKEDANSQYSLEQQADGILARGMIKD
jgi:hypothetical protein